MSECIYVGSELDLFAQAIHWKSYWRCQLRSLITGSVLELGAGKGANTRLLEDLACSHWTCVEPDPTLCAELRAGIRPGSRTEVIAGTLADLPESAQFDTILYLDVLEHIEDDASELRLAVRHLRQGGNLIVLAPAHQWLYSPFDAAIGHFRRYCRRSLISTVPSKLSLVYLRYLDVAGLMASLGNRLLLRRSLPTKEQLRFWDSCLVPISRRLDALLRYRMGKSILGVWRKAD